MHHALRGVDRESIRVQRTALSVVLFAGPATLGTLGLIASVLSGSPILLSLALLHLLTAAVFLAVRRGLTLRLRAVDESTDEEETPVREPWIYAWCVRLVALDTLFISVVSVWGDLLLPSLGFGANPGSWPLELGKIASAWSTTIGPSPLALTIVLSVLAITAAGLATAAVYLHGAPSRDLPEGRGLARWLRLAFWFHVVAIVCVILRLVDRSVGEGVIAAALLITVGVLALELSLRMIGRRRPIPGQPLPQLGRRVTDLLSLHLVASRFNLSASFFTVLAEVFGIDLKGTWALTFIRRSIVPIGLILVVVGWLSTAFVVIDVHEVGVVERFGQVVASEDGQDDAELLDPGLHVLWPWPVDRVRVASTGRVQEATIGFRGQREGAALLWTTSHATQEHKLLLGDGRDLISINAVVQYRVNDPIQFLYHTQNPEDSLVLLADRILLRETVHRTLDEVLSENLSSFANTVEADLQDAVDDQRLGIEIVDLTLLGLHPPIDVAPAYQAVAGARIEQHTRVLEAQTYHEEALPRVTAEANRIESDALAYEAERLADARGESAAFDALVRSYLAHPELFQFRTRLETLERHLRDKPFHVIDHRIERDGGEIWFLD